jgi:hypothetical protein
MTLMSRVSLPKILAVRSTSSIPVTPVRITAAGEVGYYAGLGLVVKFGL